MNSDPPNLELKDENLNYEEIKKEFKDEIPSEIIDVSQLNKAESMKQMERYAILSSSSYETYQHGKYISEAMVQKLLPNFYLDKNLTDELSTTFVNKKSDGSNDVVISYRGTQTINDLGVDVFQILTGAPIEKLVGVNTGRYKISQSKYEAVKKAYPNADITTTGHSLGGNQAFFIGKSNNIKSYGFNSGSSPIDLITNMGISNSPENQFTHYYTAGDVIGLSQSIIGSKEDKLVLIKPHKWIDDLTTTAKTTVAGGLVGGPIGSGVGLALGSLSTMLDLHSLSNFLPKSSFLETLEKDDIAFRWVKPIHHSLKEEHRITSKGNIHDFDNFEPIIITDFINNIKKCNNKYKKCKKITQ